MVSGFLISPKDHLRICSGEASDILMPVYFLGSVGLAKKSYNVSIMAFIPFHVSIGDFRAHSTTTSHFGRRCIPFGGVAKTRNIQISLRLRALPAGRLSAKNCDLVFS
jgi:hypothetical protein